MGNMCTKFQVDWTSTSVKTTLTKNFNLKRDKQIRKHLCPSTIICIIGGGIKRRKYQILRTAYYWVLFSSQIHSETKSPVALKCMILLEKLHVTTGTRTRDLFVARQRVNQLS